MHRLGHVAIVFALSLMLLGSALADTSSCGNSCGTDVHSHESEVDLDYDNEQKAWLYEFLGGQEFSEAEEADLMTLFTKELDKTHAASESSSVDANNDFLAEHDSAASGYAKQDLLIVAENENTNFVQITALSSNKNNFLVSASSEEGFEESEHDLIAKSSSFSADHNEAEADTFSLSLLDLLDSHEASAAEGSDFEAIKKAGAKEETELEYESEEDVFDKSSSGWGVFGPGFFYGLRGSILADLN